MTTKPNDYILSCFNENKLLDASEYDSITDTNLACMIHYAMNDHFFLPKAAECLQPLVLRIMNIPDLTALISPGTTLTLGDAIFRGSKTFGTGKGIFTIQDNSEINDRYLNHGKFGVARLLFQLNTHVESLNKKQKTATHEKMSGYSDTLRNAFIAYLQSDESTEAQKTLDTIWKKTICDAKSESKRNFIFPFLETTLTEILNKLEQIDKYNPRDITAELTEILNYWEQIKEIRKKQPIRFVRHTTLWGQSKNIDPIERAGDAFVEFLTRKTIAENGYVAIRKAFEKVLQNSPDQCNMKKFKLDSKQLQAYALEPSTFWYVMYLLSIFITPVVSITLFYLFLHLPGLALVGLGALATVCMIAATVCAGFSEQWRYSYYSNKFLTAINNEVQTPPAIVEAEGTKTAGSDCAYTENAITNS